MIQSTTSINQRKPIEISTQRANKRQINKKGIPQSIKTNHQKPKNSKNKQISPIWDMGTSTIDHNKSGQSTNLALEWNPILIKTLAPLGVFLGIHNRTSHTPPILRNSEVPNSAIVRSLDAFRRYHRQAVLLHHKLRYSRRHHYQTHHHKP